MDFKINIGTLGDTIKEYNNLIDKLSEEKKSIDSTLNKLYETGWSGQAKEKFELVHLKTSSAFLELESEVKATRDILEKEALKESKVLKKECDNFLYSVSNNTADMISSESSDGIVSISKNDLDSMIDNITACISLNYDMCKMFINKMDEKNSFKYSSVDFSEEIDRLIYEYSKQTGKLFNLHAALGKYKSDIDAFEEKLIPMFNKLVTRRNGEELVSKLKPNYLNNNFDDLHRGVDIDAIKDNSRFKNTSISKTGSSSVPLEGKELEEREDIPIFNKKTHYIDGTLVKRQMDDGTYVLGRASSPNDKSISFFSAIDKEAVKNHTSVKDEVKSYGYGVVGGIDRFSNSCQDADFWIGEHILGLDMDKDLGNGYTYREIKDKRNENFKQDYAELEAKAPNKEQFNDGAKATGTTLDTISIAMAAKGAKSLYQYGKNIYQYGKSLGNSGFEVKNIFNNKDYLVGFGERYGHPIVEEGFNNSGVNGFIKQMRNNKFGVLAVEKSSIPNNSVGLSVQNSSKFPAISERFYNPTSFSEISSLKTPGYLNTMSSIGKNAYWTGSAANALNGSNSLGLIKPPIDVETYISELPKVYKQEYINALIYNTIKNEIGANASNIPVAVNGGSVPTINNNSSAPTINSGVPNLGGDTKININTTIRKVDLTLDKEFMEDAKKCSKKIPKSIRKGYNYSYAKIDIKEIEKKEYYAHSRLNSNKYPKDKRVNIEDISELPQERIFKTFKLNSKNTSEILNKGMETEEIPWDRILDGESKILHDIAKRLGNQKLVKGSIKLYSQLDCCPSCRYVIQQFREKYPYIELEIIYEKDFY